APPAGPAPCAAAPPPRGGGGGVGGGGGGGAGPRAPGGGGGRRPPPPGLFSTGRDLAVFCRTLLAGGSYGPARILGPGFVDLLLTPPGLGFALDQPWFMGELSGRGAAGHTGFTGTSLVLDRATDTYVILLANTVHPRRPSTPDSRPRAEAATRVARAVRGM
ncbi:serine hydrolase, partial [Streptomyces sp. NPDC007056]|uniref:serine hydrolase n=1 Tax=Streptomyces sp. NPDC007056 TaxID=3155358 RepID=UPI0033F0986F